MNEAIIEAIAEHSAFGTDEVYRVWLLFKSYDVLVAGCELAEKTGSSNKIHGLLLLTVIHHHVTVIDNKKNGSSCQKTKLACLSNTATRRLPSYPRQPVGRRGLFSLRRKCANTYGIM